MDIAVELTEELPTHWVVVVTKDPEHITVQVSPRVEAAALFALRDDIGDAVAGLIDSNPGSEGGS